MIYSFKEKAKKAIKLVKEESLIIYLILSLFIAYIFVAYIDWYDENVVSILSQFKSNIWMQLLTGVLIVIAVYDLISKSLLLYHYDWKVILSLFLVSILLAYYQKSEKYYYIYWICHVSYVDVIRIFGFLYSIVAASVNLYRMYRSKCERNKKKQEEILSDYPIETKEEDIFSFDNDANKLADKINGLDRKKTWSIAITAPWGTGKTSFMNLVIENINENEFEIVRFNPRDCKSFKTIQEDFFTAIACVLSKYDSRCSNTIKDYMASLQLIDNRGIIEKLTSFYQIWNKVELKESIEKSFASLNKRVLVMIDDFDRLSKAEILEVLKLIDSNAAFTNLIFLTAYDKEQVNRMLGDDFRTKDACFVDKFFNLEFAIPLRSYTYISRYINEKLCELLKADSSETDKIHRTIKYWRTTFEIFLPTLRDAKRYINQFLLDFQGVRGDVVVNEFLLVQLIKYRYPEQYRSLYKKEYITEGVGIDNYNLYIKENVNKGLNIYPILKRLFPDSPTRNSYGTAENHIFHTQSFVYYFENQISGSLRVADMKKLFSLPWNEVTNPIDGWITNNESYDFIDYLNRLYRSKFNNEEFLRYAEMVTYIACKEPKSDAYELFTKIIYIEYLKANNIKTESERTKYKNRLLEIIEGNDPQLFTRIHLDYKTLRKNEDEYLIKDNDIWPLIKEKFIQTTKDDSADDDNLINWLHRCIDNMEETTRKIFLDKECLKAYRQRVEKNPDYYIKTFVRLGMIASSPDWNTIACEPFWEQIFEDENRFENFLLECKNKKIEKSELAWNFWLLYKANNYKPIEFENQGNVQEKIDNKLAREVQELKKMQNIETNVSLIPDSISDEGERTTNKELLSQYKEELDDITLNISLNGKIRKAIDEKIKKLGIFE